MQTVKEEGLQSNLLMFCSSVYLAGAEKCLWSTMNSDLTGSCFLYENFFIKRLNNMPFKPQILHRHRLKASFQPGPIDSPNDIKQLSPYRGIGFKRKFQEFQSDLTQ